jgi:hypothetical protein
MFEMHFEDGDRILCLKFTGTVTPADFQTHMPEVEEAYGRIKPSRLLLDWRGIEDVAPEVESHLLHARIQHRGSFERMAIIGTPKMQEEARKVDEIMECEVRFYEPDEEPEAREWLKGD